jgi:hypothetical protein
MEGEKSTVAFSCRHPPQNSIAALKKASQVFLARVTSNSSNISTNNVLENFCYVCGGQKKN